MKKIFGITAVFLSIFVISTQHALASVYYQSGSNGIDVSYPNCSTKLPVVNFGIVGLNNGTVYSQNPCAGTQSKNFSNLSFYVNTGLNATTSSVYYSKALSVCNNDPYCASYKYGYDAGIESVNYAKSLGINSTKWWLDVETENSWSTNTLLNQRSLQGEYDAILASGANLIGVYSTTAQWQTIAGGWKNNWPSWGATTWTTAQQAIKYCTGHQFTGGPSLLMQYKSNRSKLDQDVAC